MIRRLRKGLSIASKIILVVAVVIAVINLFFYFFSKDQPKTTYNPVLETRKKVYENINNPALQATKKDKQIMSVYRSGVCLLLGEACTNNPNDGDKYFNRSIFGGMAKLIAFPYTNPPASGIYWAYSGLQKAGFVPKTYAAEGIGFSALKPLSKLWELFRNVAYMLVVIALLIIGFMIMFRVKINPQTMVTLENSLPRIVITLLLITFSFAIGGFLIDLMYVVTSLGLSIIAKNGIFNLDPRLQADVISGGGGLSKLFDLILGNDDVWGIGGAILAFLPITINVIIRVVVAGFALYAIHAWAKPIGRYCIDGLLGDDAGISGLLGVLVSLSCIAVVYPLVFLFSPLILSLLIIGLTGLFVFFRIFFLLFAAYLRILLAILFSPVILLLNAIPGRNMFGVWLKGLVADLIVFPVTIIFTALSAIVINIPPANGNFWNPPFLYTIDPAAFNIVVGVSILFVIPDVIKSMRQLLGIKQSPFKLGPSVLFAGFTGVGGVTGGISQKLASVHYAKQGWDLLKGGLEKVRGRGGS